MHSSRTNYLEIVVTLIYLLSSAISIYSFFNIDQGIALTIMTCLAIFLIFIFLYFSRRHRTYSRFFRIQTDLKSLSNQMRIFHAAMSINATNQQIQIALETMIVTTLEIASRVFTTLTGAPCVASIMMPDDDVNSDERVEHFITTRYSSNVDPDRQNSKSIPLKYDEGILEKALSSNRVIAWCLSTARSEFRETRMNADEFYRSGMTCPVAVKGEAYAILNIDTTKYSAFRESEKNVAYIFSNLLAGVFELSEAEWENDFSADEMIEEEK